MKLIFTSLSIFFTITFQTLLADTKQAETGSVGATVSKNLTEELRVGKAKVETLCSACHGLDGVAASGGNSVIIPNLTAQHKDYLIAKLKDYKSRSQQNGLMVPIAANLSDIDMIEIADYFAKQSPKIYFTSDEESVVAEKIYRGGDKSRGIPACMSCHGPNGAGNPAAKYPALRGQHADYTEGQLLSYRDRTRDTDQQMMMRSIAAKLSDEEITQLSKYVSALH